mmetsp:Transcript_10938/g.19985  ORF Transcript_10938/g.19985 Transcript_10938/m.19985 type:complete len:141 (+) Transcript_10938:38-460(+)
MMLRPLLILSFAASLASAFNINATPQKIPAIAPTAEQCTRRNILHRTASLGFLTIISTAAAAAPANADVIRSPGKCANGEGEGCDSLAEDNELIQSLQKKSSENREANQRVGIKGDFGFIGWAAAAVILNDLTSSFFEKR